MTRATGTRDNGDIARCPFYHTAGPNCTTAWHGAFSRHVHAGIMQRLASLKFSGTGDATVPVVFPYRALKGFSARL